MCVNSGWKVRGRAAAHAESDKDDEESERAEAGPILKGGAEADAAIVENGQQSGQGQADDEVREKDRASGDAIEFHRVQAGKM